MSENNDTSNESNSLDSLQTSRIPVLRTGVLRPSVLGPSVLGSALSNSVIAGDGTDAVATATKAKVEVACNPFMKEQKIEEDTESNEEASGGNVDVTEMVAVKNTDTTEVMTADEKKTEPDEEVDERPDPLTLLRKNGLERSNMFAAAKNSIPRVEKSGFVFGQNVHERVVGENINPDGSVKTENSDDGATSGELLFSSVIQNAAAKTASESEGNSGTGAVAKETDTKSLNDVAREYEESRAQKRKYEEVETFTGEENEVNIVDINCKLFAFVNSNWEERGRGSLRLNDSKKELECSRVVFRTSGNLRLLLNTKVWAGMVAEHPSQKSLRLTAMDNTGKIKIFLAMARPVDINLLHKALVQRIDLRKSTHPEEECRADVVENNGEESKNGSAIVPPNEEEVVKAAAVAEPPEHEDSTEPSPKKSLLAETNN